MTIYDISEKAGVSIATVSRVLNGSGSVSEKTRQKVLDIIHQCGYTPNAFARGLGLNTMKTIGIMCADCSDLYLAKAVSYLEKMLRSGGYDSILSCTGYDLEEKAASMNLLLSKKVDGIILTGSNFIYDTKEENQYILEAAEQVPVMLLNASLPVPNVYSVLCDDFRATYDATREMLAAGITDPLYFYNSASYSGRRKLAGFQAAMREAGGGADRILFFRGSHEDIPAMAAALGALRKEGLSFHGVIAADDVLALGAVKYAAAGGLAVPGDLAVIGYNNSLLADCCEPGLTSVDNRLENLCSHLISTLMAVLDGKEMPRESYFPGKLVRRGTTPQCS